MTYPRQHTIDNPKLKSLLEKKRTLILEGRELTQDIEDIENGNKEIDQQIQKLESEVDIKEFEIEAQAITERMKAIMMEAEEVQNKIYAKLKAEIPPELGEKYDKNKTLQEELENKRNKVGLKIQKTKDLIVPLVQKEARSLLQDEFEDFSDVRLENGEVVIDIISHFENWKEARNKKLKESYLPKSK